MSKLSDFLEQIESIDSQIDGLKSAKSKLEAIDYENYDLIKATVSYYTYLEIGKVDLAVFFEMPKNFIDGCAFVESYSMKRFGHLLVVHQKDDMSIEVEIQAKHSNATDEPFLLDYRFLSENEVIVFEYYKDKNPLIKDRTHYHLLKLDSTKQGFVEKTKLTQKQYSELCKKSYESLEELKKATRMQLVRNKVIEEINEIRNR